MRRAEFLLLTACALAAASSAHAASAASRQGSSARCTAGPPELPDATFRGKLRPTPTAICTYGLRALYGRIATLLAARRRSLRVEFVEKLFDIPAMTTSYDDPRIADYTTVLRGAGGWTFILWVREAFYPLDRRGAMFRPGLRPRRRALVSRATVMVDSMLLQPREPQPVSTGCKTVAAALRLAEKAGWRDVTPFTYVTDGGPHMPSLARGRGETLSINMPLKGGLATEAELEGTCLTDFEISQSPEGQR